MKTPPYFCCTPVPPEHQMPLVNYGSQQMNDRLALTDSGQVPVLRRYLRS